MDVFRAICGRKRVSGDGKALTGRATAGTLIRNRLPLVQGPTNARAETAQLAGSGEPFQRPCGWGLRAGSLAATLLVCAVFRPHSCQQCPFAGVSVRGCRAAQNPAIAPSGPRKDASWQLPALRRPVIRRAVPRPCARNRQAPTLPAESHSDGSPNNLRSPTFSPSRPSRSTGWWAMRLGRPGRLNDPHARSGSGGDSRGDQSDRGLLRHDVALVLGAALRRGEGVHRGVQGEGSHLLRPVVRDGGVHQPLDWRDQEPDGVHGRLPDHDPEGHVHHQRHRACRGEPARPVAGRVLRQAARQDLRPRPVVGQGHPEPRRVARVRRRQARHGRRPHRPQAPAGGHRPAQGHRLEQRADPRAVRLVRADDDHAREGPHRRPGRGAAGHLPQAAAGRAADAGERPDAAGQPVLQLEAVRRRARSAGTSSTRSWTSTSRSRPAR